LSLQFRRASASDARRTERRADEEDDERMRRFSLPRFFEAGTLRVRAGGDSAPAGATRTGRDASTATSRVIH
jgi:hypothetical protein